MKVSSFSQYKKKLLWYRCYIACQCHCISFSNSSSSNNDSSARPSSSVNDNKKSFHKRPLPSNLIALSSPLGKQYFGCAFNAGCMEAFFPLIEQFNTQSEPSYCSLSSLAMILNALNHDPKKVWKGPWRWVTEQTLQCESSEICGHTLEKVQNGGLSFKEFESLARCHGVRMSSHIVNPKPNCTTIQSSFSSLSTVASNNVSSGAPSSANRSDECSKTIEQQRQHMVGFAEFKRLVENTCADPSARTFIIVNFARSVLGQTGSGHFSPIGGYFQHDSGRMYVLVMDVARFKYPPYWVDMRKLWEAMGTIDTDTQQPRGYFVISSWDDIGGNSNSSSIGNSAECSHIDDLVVPPAVNDSLLGISNKFTANLSGEPQQPNNAPSSTKCSCPPKIRTWVEYSETTIP